MLQKRNEWYWKQDRRFLLQNDGQIKYYDEEEQKGTVIMDKNARCIRTGKLSFEIQIVNRTYFLFGKTITEVEQWIEEI